MEVVGSDSVTKRSFYPSAPTSPDRDRGREGDRESWSFETMLFYSVPGSPMTEPATPKMASSEHQLGDNFEFDTSRRFDSAPPNGDDWDDLLLESDGRERWKQREQGREWPQSPPHGRRKSYDHPAPCMVFADELFCDGKVKPLKLKLPPRLQSSSTRDDGEGASGWSPASVSPLPPPSPRKMSAAMRRGMSLRVDDEFDPFEVALERVREGDDREERERGRRRSRSLSPFRGSCGGGGGKVVNLRMCESTRWTQDGGGRDEAEKRAEVVGGQMWRAKTKVEPLPLEHFDPAHEGKSPIGYREDAVQRQMVLAEPRGVRFARKMRLVNMDHHHEQTSPSNPTTGNTNTTAVSGLELIKKPREARVSKRQRLKRFLLGRTKSLGTSEEKMEVSTEEEVRVRRRPSMLRTFRFNKSRSSGSAPCECNEGDGKQVSRAAQMTFVHYRPRMMLCLGYGIKSPTNEE